MNMLCRFLGHRYEYTRTVQHSGVTTFICARCGNEIDRAAIMAQTRWPETAEQATADALIIHGARVATACQSVAAQRMHEAFEHDREAPEFKPALSLYLDAISQTIAQAQVVVALVETQKRAPSEADDLARLIWELTEDGGVLPELMWDYLNARGVDADAVFKIADADAEPGGSGS